LTSVRILREITSRDCICFCIDFTRNQLTVIRQGLRHHQRAIAGEHSKLENAFGAAQADEHLKEATLDDADLHLGPLHDSIGFLPKTDIQISFRLSVVASELLNRSIDEPIHKISVI